MLLILPSRSIPPLTLISLPLPHSQDISIDSQLLVPGVTVPYLIPLCSTGPSSESRQLSVTQFPCLYPRDSQAKCHRGQADDLRAG